MRARERHGPPLVRRRHGPGQQTVPATTRTSPETLGRHRSSTGLGTSTPDAAMLAELSRLVDAGSLRVIVAETFPLERAGDAHARVEAGHVRGKVILEVS